MAVNPPNRVGIKQTRRYSAAGGGHTNASVELDVEQLPAEIVLAEVVPPVLGISGGITVEGPEGQTLPVACRPLPNGGYRYVLRHEPGPTDRGRWTWRYSVAPGLHATYRETAFCDRDGRGPIMFCDHVLLIPCDAFELHIELGSRVDTALPIIGGPEESSQELTPTACTWKLSDDRKAIRLRFAGPIVGKRYGVRYWFDTGSSEPRADMLRMAEAILRVCQGDGADDGSSSGRLRKQVEHAVNVTLSRGVESDDQHSVLGDGATWNVLIWNRARRRLVPCFGAHKNFNGASELGMGEGVAGQCFRTWLPMGHQRSLGGGQRLYAQDQLGSDDWQFAVPLTFGADNCPVGVISFSGRDAQTESVKAIEVLCRQFDVLSREPPGMHGFVHHLYWIINANFWKAVADIPLLEPALRELAHDFALSYKNLNYKSRSFAISSPPPQPLSDLELDDAPHSAIYPSSKTDRSMPGLSPPSQEVHAAIINSRGVIWGALITGAFAVVAAIVTTFVASQPPTTAVRPVKPASPVTVDGALSDAGTP